jgi:hypothetical protein
MLLCFAIIVLVILFFIKKRKVIVVQCDTRNEDFIKLSKNVNKLACSSMNYEYKFIDINMNKYKDIHPATAKIYVVDELIKHYSKDTILIFLDSDAWIKDVKAVDSIVKEIERGDKIGCFERDVYNKNNTYINSGVYIIKLNDDMRSIFTNIKNDIDKNPEHKTNWPFDQYYISKYIFNNKDKFIICKPNTMNTPKGKIIVHDWTKNNEYMKMSMNIILKNGFQVNNNFKISDYIDSHTFPNEIDEETFEEYKDYTKSITK